MYFKFACPHCDKTLKVRDELAGRKCGCPYCKSTITVPQPEIPDAPSFDLTKLDRKASPSRTKQKPAAKSSGAVTEGTDVSMLLSGLLAVVGSAIFLGLLAPVWLYGLTLGELFFERGWVPFALVFLMAWAVAILFLKSRKLRRQRASMLFDLLPTELSEDISQHSLDKFLQHVRNLPVNPSSSFLVNRVLRGLEHFRVRQSTPEVAAMLASQSDIDANAVDSSYSLLKVFIWAIPILGFIGTVIGISAAVGGFSGSLDQAQDISVLKDSLNGVTGGLATAFDTTLIALVMSMLVMFPSTSMQKAEEDLLNWVDEYCNENLLKRLNDGPRGNTTSPASPPASLEQAIQAAMATHHAELRTWSKKLEQIGSVISGEVAAGWKEISQQQQAEQQQIAEGTTKVAEMASDFGSHLQQLTETTEALRSSLANVEQSVAALNTVLGQLNGKQVQIEQLKKRSWFGR